jgi:hypothetical protein
MNYTIYHGNAKPISVSGKKACEILEFAERFRTWHIYDTRDKPAINKLIKKDCLEIKGGKYYRFKYPN